MQWFSLMKQWFLVHKCYIVMRVICCIYSLDKSINLNVYVYILISNEFSRLHNLRPWYWNSLLYSFISSEENTCTLCCSYSQSLQFSFLIPPGTHHYCVDRGMIGLPDTSTHSRQCDTNTG